MDIELNPVKGERWCTGVYPKSEKYIRVQYTGFKDCKGKEIYEGDIVQIEKIDSTVYSAQVRFFNGTFCIYTSNSDINIESVKGHNVLMHIAFDWNEYQPFYEVIGNIYENSNLLSIPRK